MFNRKNLVFSFLILGLALAGISACSKSDDAGAGGTTALSEFATLLAQEMTLASPTAKASASAIVFSKSAQDGGFEVFSGPEATDTASKKTDALEELLADAAPSTCNIALTLQNSGRANCYGPSVAYTNHPHDASSGSWPGGDLGIWEDSETGGEACVAAQLNIQMKGVASMVDLGQFIVAGMGCVANKDGIALPSAASTSVDMTSAMAGKITVNGTALTVTSAALARDADVSGNPVYVTTLSGTAGTRTIDIRLKHIPTTSDDSTNRGKVSVKVSNTAPAGTDGVSLEYEKLSSTSGKFLLKSTNFNAAAQSPFVSGSNYTVDFSKPWNNNANYFLGSMNPADYTGQFAYAWQAGNGDSHTRVMNLIISNSSGTPAGTGFFGFGPTVQTGAGSIAGMICAWTGPDQTHVPVLKVQKQEITYSSGKFVVSGTPNTVYDPVAACTSSANMPMTWGTSGTRNANTTTENLAAQSEVATTIGTLPTAPTAVD